jgi:hypothetical protein
MKLVQTWPEGSTGNSSADQVPTKLDYAKSRTKWGYEVSTVTPGARPLSWFKLLLQAREAPKGETQAPAPARTRGYSGGRRQGLDALLDGLKISPDAGSQLMPAQHTGKILKELNIAPVQAVADFLTKIKETTLASIERTYMLDDLVDTKVEWILTVPAIWTDQAKNSMIQAASQAGLGESGLDFELTSEPECGATYSLKAIQPNDLEVSSVLARIRVR